MPAILLLLSLKCIAVCAWTEEELFIYDLVEEVGENFYDFYGIPKVSFCIFSAHNSRLHIYIHVNTRIHVCNQFTIRTYQALLMYGISGKSSMWQFTFVLLVTQELKSSAVCFILLVTQEFKFFVVYFYPYLLEMFFSFQIVIMVE